MPAEDVPVEGLDKWLDYANLKYNRPALNRAAAGLPTG